MVTDADLENQKHGDRDVIEALRRAGSDLSKPHTIEHHFVCATRAKAEEIQAWGVGNGLTASEIREGEHSGRRYYYFDFVIATIPTLENIYADTSRLRIVARDLGAEYDGWGCAVMR